MTHPDLILVRALMARRTPWKSRWRDVRHESGRSNDCDVGVKTLPWEFKRGERGVTVIYLLINYISQERIMADGKEGRGRYCSKEGAIAHKKKKKMKALAHRLIGQSGSYIYRSHQLCIMSL